ncbi:MAG TPA: PKD domain-containing protein, partial [Candidatus Thermoplasmatota archaeon]|nr:PKD domain-containing protein [Candidatus Thermoplasmatota archaeon]
VYNTPPVPRIILPDEPVFRGQTVQLHGSATDADGDAIVDWTWELGDGTVAYGATASRAYHELGAYLVTLWARDSEGEVGVDTAELRVVNRPPLVVGSFAPSSPAVGETVVFSASGTDPDVPNGRVAFEWAFSDGARFDGPMVERAFASPGEHTVTLVGIDADGGASEPYVLLVRVGP